MKKLFVMSAIVLGTVAFSACDSKPAAEAAESTSEMLDSTAEVATEAIDSTKDAADSTMNAVADSVSK